MSGVVLLVAGIAACRARTSDMGSAGAVIAPSCTKSAPVTDPVVRFDRMHPLRDCPDGTLAALAPGWRALDRKEAHVGTPELDACLPGRFGAASVVVFASAPQSHSKAGASYVGRIVLVDRAGKIVIEVPENDGGSGQLEGVLDLDGDGTDEVIERVRDRIVAISRQIRGLTGEPCLTRDIALPADCEVFDETGTASTMVPACTSSTTTNCFSIVADTSCPGQGLKLALSPAPSADTVSSVRCRL